MVPASASEGKKSGTGFRILRSNLEDNCLRDDSQDSGKFPIFTNSSKE